MPKETKNDEIALLVTKVTMELDTGLSSYDPREQEEADCSLGGIR